MARTGNIYEKWLRGDNNVNIQGRIMVLVHSTSSHCDLSIYQVWFKQQQCFFAAQGTVTDRQTDRQSGDKVIFKRLYINVNVKIYCINSDSYIEHASPVSWQGSPSEFHQMSASFRSAPWLCRNGWELYWHWSRPVHHSHHPSNFQVRSQTICILVMDLLYQYTI